LERHQTKTGPGPWGGGMGTEQLKELKRLQKQNERLRHAISDLTLDKLILKEAASGNF